jgi:hypothetical protein
MLTTDRVAGGALVVVALVVLWESRRLPLGTLRHPGPAYMPVVLAVLLIVFGVLLVLINSKAAAVGRVGWGEWRHAAIIFVVCAFAAVALERLGFRITIAAVVGFLLGAVERRGVIFSIVFAVAFAGGTFLLFDTLLRVPLPRGPFGL